MKYSIYWRNPRSGYENWGIFADRADRESTIKNRKYLKGLGHECKVTLEDGTEIEVEDDDT